MCNIMKLWDSLCNTPRLGIWISWQLWKLSAGVHHTDVDYRAPGSYLVERQYTIEKGLKKTLTRHLAAWKERRTEKKINNDNFVLRYPVLLRGYSHLLFHSSLSIVDVIHHSTIRWYELIRSSMNDASLRNAALTINARSNYKEKDDIFLDVLRTWRD